jgi:hypothetical protein
MFNIKNITEISPQIIKKNNNIRKLAIQLRIINLNRARKKALLNRILNNKNNKPSSDDSSVFDDISIRDDSSVFDDISIRDDSSVFDDISIRDDISCISEETNNEEPNKMLIPEPISEEPIHEPIPHLLPDTIPDLLPETIPDLLPGPTPDLLPGPIPDQISEDPIPDQISEPISEEPISEQIPEPTAHELFIKYLLFLENQIEKKKS